MMGFTVQGGSAFFEDGNYILSYAQFPDPDAKGKFSSLTCTVKFDPSNLYASASEMSIVNYYGEASFTKDKVTLGTFDQLNKDDILSQGPWTLAGDPASTSDTVWQ